MARVPLVPLGLESPNRVQRAQLPQLPPSTPEPLLILNLSSVAATFSKRRGLCKASRLEATAGMKT